MPLSDSTKWMLINSKVDPFKLAQKTGESEKEMWEYLEELRRALAAMEKEREAYLPQLAKEVEAFRDELPKEMRKQFRLNHLKEEHKSAVKKFEALCVDLAEGATDDETYAADAEKELKRITLEVKVVQGHDEGITREMIERARAHPITNLIESKRDMAVCPFHNEKTPSLYLKNNFYHCFGCNASGDTIDLVMHTQGFTFKQAVEYLN